MVVVYETPGEPWANSGRRTLAAPRFDPGVPVVESRWTRNGLAISSKRKTVPA